MEGEGARRNVNGVSSGVAENRAGVALAAAGVSVPGVGSAWASGYPVAAVGV